MIARPIPSNSPPPQASGHTIIVNGVEQPTMSKLELAGEGVTAEIQADTNKITISLPTDVSGGGF